MKISVSKKGGLEAADEEFVRGISANQETSRWKSYCRWDGLEPRQLRRRRGQQRTRRSPRSQPTTRRKRRRINRKRQRRNSRLATPPTIFTGPVAKVEKKEVWQKSIGHSSARAVAGLVKRRLRRRIQINTAFKKPAIVVAPKMRKRRSRGQGWGPSHVVQPKENGGSWEAGPSLGPTATPKVDQINIDKKEKHENVRSNQNTLCYFHPFRDILFTSSLLKPTLKNIL